MRDMNLRDMKMPHHVAGVEIARHENARNAIVWNTECCICLSIAEQECMSRQERAPDFTVFVTHVDHTFPVLYALMTSKTTDLYKTVVQKLHEIAPDFQPNQVIADFEEAPAAAIRAVYGNDLTVSGCWFHYGGQAIMKRLKIGLTQAYQNEETTQAVFRCLLALPLLPVTDMDPAFQDVKVLVQ